MRSKRSNSSSRMANGMRKLGFAKVADGVWLMALGAWSCENC